MTLFQKSTTKIVQAEVDLEMARTKFMDWNKQKLS